MKSIIVSPSLDPTQNVSGISAVTQFIILNNLQVDYIHFELGKKDREKGGIFRVKSIISSLFKWNKLLKDNSDAIIHYNFPLSRSSILRDPMFMYIAKRKKMKMVIHIHGGNFLTASYTPRYLQWILKKTFALPCPFIVLSDLEKQLVSKKYSCKKIHVLPNCVDLTEASKFTKGIKESQEPLVMGYLGRIAETKGMGFLLEACKELKNRNIRFILRIAGKEEVDHQYLPLFEKELGNQFIYDGVVYGKAKDDFLKRLDVFMLPSYFEGLPMSLLECMSFGVVPITTHVGSIGEVVIQNENGVFIQVKDSNTIVEQFIGLNENREQLHTLSQHAKDTIFKLFTPSIYINKLNRLYQNPDCHD